MTGVGSRHRPRRDWKPVAASVTRPRAVTSIHTHPGSEAYYVLAGEAAQKTPHGTERIAAGQTLAGHGPDTVMQFMNSGTTNVSYFALFVVDATKPFSSPAKFD